MGSGVPRGSGERCVDQVLTTFSPGTEKMVHWDAGINPFQLYIICLRDFTLSAGAAEALPVSLRLFCFEGFLALFSPCDVHFSRWLIQPAQPDGARWD